MKKYILRNADDDEFTSLIPARNKDEKQRCNQMTKEKLLMLAENLYEEALKDEIKQIMTKKDILNPFEDAE